MIAGPATLPLLLLASTLGVMAGAVIMPVLEMIRGNLGVGGTAAGLIITTHGLAIAVTSPLAGWAIDRWGVRRPLAGGLILYGLAGGAGLFITSYPALIADRAVFGMGAAVVFTGTTVALLALYQGPERQQVMGWRTTATSLGGVLWPLLGGALGGLSWHAPFAIYLIGIPIGIAALGLIPETRRSAGRGDGNILLLLRQQPALLGVYGLFALMFIMLYSLAVFLPQRLGELGVTAPILISLYMVSAAGTASLAGLVYAKLRERASYAALLRITFLTWALAFLILGTVDRPALLITASVLFGLGNGVAFPALTALMGEIVPPALLGRATAISGTVVFLGQFISPIILGPVIAATSITGGYLIEAGIAALTLLLLFFV